MSNSYNSLIRLSFYESSFHFFLKRLNSFNTLSSNRVASLPSRELITNPLVNNYLSNLHSIYNVSLSNKFTKLFTNNLPTNPTTLIYKDDSIKLTGDIVLVQKPSYYLTKKRLDILYNLTKYSPNTNLNLRYFSKLRLKKPFKLNLLCPDELKKFKGKVKI